MMDDEGQSKAEQQVEENLRRVFDQISSEEVPDHLKSLLDRLRQQEAGDDQT